jgi:hypothetical protein
MALLDYYEPSWLWEACVSEKYQPVYNKSFDNFKICTLEIYQLYRRSSWAAPLSPLKNINPQRANA